MISQWIEAYCLTKKGAKKDFKQEWNATRFLLNDKMFALAGRDNSGRTIITLKLEPMNGEVLRQMYKSVIPGYYMNKTHWNSVLLDEGIPDEVLKEMIDESYQLIVNSLSKKARELLLNQ